MSDVRMSQVILPKAFVTIEGDADKQVVITRMAESLVTARRLKAAQVDEVVDGAMQREAIGSTGIGHGIAIPHCRTDLVKNIVCAFGHCPQGVDFDSLDGEMVHSIFFLLTPVDQKEQHLTLMKSFASQIRKENFCEFLHQVQDAQSAIDLLAEFENQ